MTTNLAGDGRHRCDWVNSYRGANCQLYRDYHDYEWGRATHDPIKIFEHLSLECFQAGLSWITILRRRDDFRRAFDQFEIAQVATYQHDKLAELYVDPTIIRHRGKINAIVHNAQVIVEMGLEYFVDVLWSYAPLRHISRVRMDQVPDCSDESVALALRMKSLGIRYFGPRNTYSLMQAVGIVNDHLQDCWVCHEIDESSREKERPRIL